MDAPSLILTDVRMPGTEGLGFLDRYRGNGARAPVEGMTAGGGRDLAVQAGQWGGADYFVTFFGEKDVLLILLAGKGAGGAPMEGRSLRTRCVAARVIGGRVPESPGMVRVVAMARKLACHRSSMSPRRRRPVGRVNPLGGAWT